MRRAICLLLAGALLGLPSVAGAETIATTTGNTQLAAGSGWLLWSEPDGDAWRLVSLHDGVKTASPVAERATAFDVDVGTDAAGRPVATFTRCATPQRYFPPFLPGGACRVRALDLDSGRERSAGIPLAPGTSDATPSMRRGQIAFSRLDPKHQQVMQILLWDPGHRRLKRLPHGPMPTGCPYRTGCADDPRVGAVAALDLGTQVLTYTWHVFAPGVAGSGGSSVVQSISLRTARSSTVGDGVAGEACTGGIDWARPLNPTAVGANVWYLELSGACEKRYAQEQRGAAGGNVAVADLPPTTIEGATDGRWLYTTVAPPPPATPGQFSPPDYRCDRDSAPCSIDREPLPTNLRPLGYKPKLNTF